MMYLIDIWGDSAKQRDDAVQILNHVVVVIVMFAVPGAGNPAQATPTEPDGVCRW